MSRPQFVPAILILMLAAASVPTQAAIVDIHVTSSDDSGPNTLRQAIIDANANDLNNNGSKIHIRLDNSDPIELNSDLPYIAARVVTIQGDPGYRPLVDGQGSHSLLVFTNSSILATVRDLDLQFGQNYAGGCIHTAASGMTKIENVSFFACEAKSPTNAEGGAIHASGPIQISKSLFMTNHANADTYAKGGAIYIYAPNKTLSISDSQFIGNKAVGIDTNASTSGGAIFAGTDVDLVIEHSSFVRNEALTPARPGFSRGGAISSTANHLEITRSSLVSNKAGRGGAIDFFQIDAPTVVNVDVRNTSFVLNKASDGVGGAISTTRGMVTLRNNSFWHNSASQSGNNLADPTGSVLAHVWNNLFTVGDGSAYACAGFDLAMPASVGYNIVPNTDCGLGAGPGDQITRGIGIIGLKLDPIDVASVWMVQDSPAIEGGNPASINDNDPQACAELDAAGNARPQLGIGIPGSGPPLPARSDIGAWESPGEAPLFYNSFDDPLHGFE